MNLFKYYNSITVRNYWEKVGFNPSPVDKAFLIDIATNTVPVKKKHADLMSLVDDADGIFINEGRFNDINDFLENIIRNKVIAEKEALKRFKSKTGGGYYVGRIYVFEEEDFIPLPEFETFNEIKEYCLQYNVQTAFISRVFEDGEFIELIFNPDFIITDVTVITSPKDALEIITTTFNLKTNMPNPFKEGDYVTLCAGDNNTVYCIDKVLSDVDVRLISEYDVIERYDWFGLEMYKEGIRE